MRRRAWLAKVFSAWGVMLGPARLSAPFGPLCVSTGLSCRGLRFGRSLRSNDGRLSVGFGFARLRLLRQRVCFGLRGLGPQQIMIVALTHRQSAQKLQRFEAAIYECNRHLFAG